MCVRERLTFRNLSSSCCAHRNACCDSRKLDSDEQKASCGVLMNWSPVRRWMHIDRVFFERRRCDSGCVQGGGGGPQASGASFGAMSGLSTAPGFVLVVQPADCLSPGCTLCALEAAGSEN